MSKTKQINSFLKNILQIFVAVLLLAGILFLVAKIYKSVQKYKTINKEIISLESQANKFDRDNKKINKLINYFSSDDFQEKEIKEKLNLVKKGERVVLVQGVQDDASQETEIINQQSEVNIKHANYYYWWQYFFGGGSNN